MSQAVLQFRTSPNADQPRRRAGDPNPADLPAAAPRRASGHTPRGRLSLLLASVWAAAPVTPQPLVGPQGQTVWTPAA